MKCGWIESLIPQYFEGVLDECQLDLINQHLENCEDCGLELGAVDRLLDLVDNVEIEYPSPVVWDNFWEDLRWKIEPPQVGQRPSLLSWSWYHDSVWKFVSIGCVLLLVVLLWVQFFPSSFSVSPFLSAEDLRTVDRFFGGIPVGQILEQIDSEEQQVDFLWESDFALNLESVEFYNLSSNTITESVYLSDLSDLDLPTYPLESLDGVVLTSVK